MIIDFHAHCFPDELAYKAVPSLAKKAGIPYFLNGTIRDIKASMKEAGIDKSIVLPIATKPSQTETINTWASSIQDESIVAFGSIHPEYKYWQEELKRIKQLGLKGIKFHNDYQGIFVDEEKMFPIYEEAFKLDLIMVFHAGLDIGLSGPYHCTPDRLLKVVRAFSGAKIVAAHMGGLVLDIYVDEEGTIDRFCVELIPLYKAIENDY